jgi:hypothetical protein
MALIEAGPKLLILKRASASRPSGEWNVDDFDVLANGEVVGRIFKVNAAPVGSPWMWTLASGTTKIGCRGTAILQRARLPWQPLPKAGGGRNFSGYAALTFRQRSPASCEARAAHRRASRRPRVIDRASVPPEPSCLTASSSSPRPD